MRWINVIAAVLVVATFWLRMADGVGQLESKPPTTPPSTEKRPIPRVSVEPSEALVSKTNKPDGKDDSDRAFESMKEWNSGQRDLFGKHLEAVKVTLGIAAGLVVFLQIAIAWSDHRREKMRLAQETVMQRKVEEFADATTANILSISGLIGQMTNVLSIQKDTQAQLKIEADRRSSDEKVRQDASKEANTVAGDFLRENTIYADGFSATLDAKFREINTFKAAGEQSLIDPDVFLVEGLYDTYLRGDDRAAIKVWTERVLGHRSTPGKVALLTRTHFLIGLSYIKLGDYPNAIQHFSQAREKSPENGCYRLARAKAIILRHRVQPLTDVERVELVKELESLHRINSIIRANPDKEQDFLGKMPRAVYNSELVYWHGVYLIHECNSETAALDKAKEMLDEELTNPDRRTSALDGLQAALKRRQRSLTVADLDDLIDQADLDKAGVRDPHDEIPITIRQARYYGWRAVLKELAGDADGSKKDEKTMSGIINRLRRQLAALRKTDRNARIYSPVTRKHEDLSVINEQMGVMSTLEPYRKDLVRAGQVAGPAANTGQNS